MGIPEDQGDGPPADASQDDHKIAEIADLPTAMPGDVPAEYEMDPNYVPDSTDV